MPRLENLRHEKFCQLYVGKASFNMSEAYKLAGYKPHNGNASRLSANESINARVKELVREKGITPEHIECELGEIAFSDLSDLMRKLLTGQTLNDSELENCKAISSIRIQKGKVDGVEVRFHDKNRALETLAKVHGMLTEKVELKATVRTIAELVDEAESDKS